MNKIITFSLLVLASSSAFSNTTYQEARVLESSPVYRSVEVSTPHQQCWQEEVVSHRQRRSHTPGLIGAVVGGALGNAVGHNKSNKRVGAVVGAILGGSIASDITRDRGRPVAYETVEHCKTVYDYTQEERLVGYDVLYTYDNREYSTRMSQAPGSTIRVRVDVQVVN